MIDAEDVKRSREAWRARWMQREAERVLDIAPGTIASIDYHATIGIEQAMPVWGDVAVAKRALAIRWLARPAGFWARVAWAWRLVWGPYVP